MKIRFISIDQEQISVKLDSIGELLESGFTYKTDSVAQTNYTIGSLIAADLYIEFEFDNVSKDSSNYYQFATSGADIKVSGTLESNQNYAFYNLFKNCKNIVDASLLSVGEGVGKYSHTNLFESCTKLTTPPTSLASGQLKDWCYSGMFNRCSSLTGVPALPSNDLALCCYNSMFYNCKSLQTAPTLSTTTLAPFCYNSMFNCCKSLTGITLPASTLVNGCYKNMFMDCKSLSSITVSFTEWNENYTGNWVKGVGPYGTFNRPNALAELYGNSKIPLGWDRILQTITIDLIPTILFDENNTSASITQYVHYDGDFPVYYMINGQLPIGVTFENGVFTYDISVVEQNTRAEVSLVIVAQDAETVMADLTIIAKAIPPQPIETPLTFKGLSNYNAKVKVDTSNISGNLYYKYSDQDYWTLIPTSTLISLEFNNFREISFKGTATNKYNSFYFDLSETPSGTYCEVYGNINSMYDSYDREGKGFYTRMFCNDLREYLPEIGSIPSGCYALKYASNLILPSSFNNYAQTFESMFMNQYSLITAPLLPAETLAPSCYYKMFHSCSSLINGPALPATTLISGCYRDMFRFCTSLTDAPVISATEFPSVRYLIDGACYRMFSKCSNLSSITVDFTLWSRINSHNWVYNVAPTGIFYKPSALTLIYDTSHIPMNWQVINKNQLLTFKGLSSSNAVQLNQHGSPSAIVLNYSKNNGPWTTYNVGDIIELNENEIVAFSGTNDHFSKDLNNFYNFAMSGTIEASSNIQSLMNFSNSCTDYCYFGLFWGCDRLITAPLLPATELANHCYLWMLRGCTSLTSAPLLPASGLTDSCYFGLFYGCTSLTDAPALSATELAYRCYYYMFRGCTSLTSAPLLPASGLTDSCYHGMFYSCTSLTSAPALPATELAQQCYGYMFNNCTSLLSAPLILPATTLAYRCYDGMFQNCNNLITAPLLPASGLAVNCYFAMFQSCTSLLSAPLILPATTLAYRCYMNMFNSCTSLTSAPALPATELAQQCYEGMFNGCLSLSSINVSFTDWNDSIQGTLEWVYNVASTGTFYKPSALSVEYGDSKIPSGWTVTNR